MNDHLAGLVDNQVLNGGGLAFLEGPTLAAQSDEAVAAAVLRGTGTWTAYFSLNGTPWLSAGWTVVTSKPVILASAAVSAC